MITWHYDHCEGRSIKGVNFLSSFYYSPKYEMGLPIGVEYVVKDLKVNTELGDVKYKSKHTKNEMMRSMVSHADWNTHFKYVLADSWFSSTENMNHITSNCNADFIFAIKSNRLVALSKEDKEQGIFQNIKSIELEGRTMSVYLKQYDNPVLVCKQLFKNDGK